MIRIVNLKKSFNSNPVLDGVNLEIETGKTTVIIGKSGCGKTVLLKHICALLVPDEGKVYVDNIDVGEAKSAELQGLRKKIGVVFQGSALLDSLTVAENISLGLREHTKLSKQEIDKIVKEKLEIVELEGVENKKPAELSGGMKKRVAIARALAMEPRYILYDEPTTALDPITAMRINKLILNLSKKVKVTAVAVTHDMKSAYMIADRMGMLTDGKIIFEGTPEQIKNCQIPEIRRFVTGGL